MDAGRFDAFSRSLATRRSRRSALQGLSAGGIAAGLFAALGVERAPAASGTCTLHIFAKTSAGPHKDKTYSGTLNLEISDGGAIDAGTFDLDDGSSHPLLGQATGRALNLRVKLANGGILELNGTADIDLLLCRGDASGVFWGPSDTDIGTWRTGDGDGSSGTGGGSTGGSTSGGSTSDGSTSTTGGGGGSTSDGGNTSGSGNASGGGGTTCQPTDCPESQVFDTSSCACACPDPTVPCGAVCCPSGSVCTDEANGNCNCPDGTELCIDTCVPSCADGSSPDPTTCQCVAPQGAACFAGQIDCGNGCIDVATNPRNCGACGNVCAGTNRVCKDGICDCALASCNSLTATACPTSELCVISCAELSSDPSNCGACGNVCPAGQCIGGVCGCPAGQTLCPGFGCTDTQVDPLNCGACGTVCLTGCEGGACRGFDLPGL